MNERIGKVYGKWTVALLAVMLVVAFALPAKAETLTYGAMTYTVSEEGEITITDCDTSVSGELVIPEQIGDYVVTNIGDYAFNGCGSLTSISLPKNITNIGRGAFLSCKQLLNINIPENVASIGFAAFSSCSSLTNIQIPEKITRIEGQTFLGCSSLVEIQLPEKLEAIDLLAFTECTSLTKIEIPTSVTSIGDSAFSSCQKLEHIKLPDGITSIGVELFWGCKGLKSIEIPAGVTKVGNNAFYNCTSLQDVYIHDLKNWCEMFWDDYRGDGTHAMVYADNLYLDGELISGELVIPEGVTKIEKYSFANCDQITSVVLPEELKSIGDYAFYRCSSLESIAIPSGVSYIGTDTFYDCTNLVVYLKSAYVRQYVVNNNIKFVAEINSISTNKVPNKKEYCLNEEFDQTGFSLLVKYTDGSSEIVTEGVELSGFDSSKAGSCTITATYREKQTTFDIEIYDEHRYDDSLDRECNICGYERIANNVEIESLPTKIEYCLNENAVYDGLALKVYYNDETVGVITSGFEINGFDSSIIGVSDVTVVYCGKETVFEVTVQEKHRYDNDSDRGCNICGYERTVNKIEVETMPTKTEYCLSEEGDFSGLKLKVYYSDDTVMYVENGFEVSGFASKEIGTCEVLVQYDGIQTTFNVNIHSHSYTDDWDKKCNLCEYSRTAESIEIESMPTKIEYCLNEEVDYSGLCIRVYYSDETVGEIASGFETSGFDSSEVGSCTILVKYEGNEVSYKLDIQPHTYTDAVDKVCDECEYVRKLTSIGVEDLGNKSTYCLDEAFDYEGFVLLLTYDDGSQGTVCDGFEVSGYDSASIQKKNTIITYEGFQTDYDVTIVEHIYSSDTDDTCDICQKKYAEGNFVYRVEHGKVIIMKCSTSERGEVVVPIKVEERPVTKIAPKAFEGCQHMTSIVLPEGIVAIGNSAFKGCYALQTITIPEGMTNIEDETFYNCSDLREILLPESLSSIGDLAFKNCYSLQNIFIPKKVTSIGENAFTNKNIVFYLNSAYAKYYAITNDIKYVVVPEILAIKTLPKKIKYSLNEEFSSEGLVLKADYYDGTSADVSDGYHVTGFDSSKTGISTIIVEFGSKTVTFDVVIHDYKTTWTADGENHWHECGVCGDKKDIDKHTYDNTCDTTCNVCGRERTIKHEYKTTWTVDGENHWHECGVCGDKKDIDMHIYDDACDTICNVCEYEREHLKPEKLEVVTLPTKSEYALGEEYDLQGLVLKATYYDGTTELVTGGYEMCGIDSDEPGVVSIDVEYHGQYVTFRVIVHEYKTEWSKDGENHWHDCSLCDSKTDKGAHTYGDWQVVTPASTQAAGLEKRICSVCKYEETREIAKLPSGTWKHDGIGWWYENLDGTYPRNCWKQIDDVWYYFNASGYILTGWQSIGGTWYYFNASGAMMTGWQTIGGAKYYFNASGAMLSGWQFMGNEWYYFAGSGAMTTGWKSIGGTWYYFNASGVMMTGLQTIGGAKYYFNASGAMLSGWQFMSNEWYYFTGSGAMATGWQSIGGTWYYFNNSGIMMTGLQTIGGAKYYFNTGGAMVTGWQSIDDVWYYFEGSGAMVSNRWIGNYYLLEDGKMAKDMWIGSYYVGPDGVWVP